MGKYLQYRGLAVIASGFPPEDDGLDNGLGKRYGRAKEGDLPRNTEDDTKGGRDEGHDGKFEKLDLCRCVLSHGSSLSDLLPWCAS